MRDVSANSMTHTRTARTTSREQSSMQQTPIPLDCGPQAAQLGKYRLVARLGQGGTGTVYLALASGVGSFRKLLVVKELRPEVAMKESSLAMFMDQAQVAARLDHPNVLQTFAAGEDNGRYFLAMEYLDGQSLRCLLERVAAGTQPDRLPLALQLYVLCEVLRALSYAHELCDHDDSPLHLAHGSVSPHNVFVNYHGQVKLDFAVGTARAGQAAGANRRSEKLAYAAPELAMGSAVDARCDVYSVGAMLWETLARRPWSGSTVTPTSSRTRAITSYPPLAEVAPDVDPQLARVCERAMAPDPQQRFESAAAFRQALEDYLRVSGQHVDSSQLASVMRALFEPERSAMHRLVERAVRETNPAEAREPGATQSGMRALRESRYETTWNMRRPPANAASGRTSAQPAAAGPKAADTSQAATSAQELLLADAALKTASGPLPRWVYGTLLASLAMAVFTGTFWLGRAWSGPEAQQITTISSATAPVAAPAAAPPAPAPEAPVANAAPASSSVQPSASTDPAPAAVVRPGARVAPRTGAPSARLAPNRRAASLPQRGSTPAARADAGQRGVAQDRSAHSANEPAMGSDLRELTPRSYRNELIDPYQ